MSRISIQILTLLKDHGPVTMDMLHRMTVPQAQKKNLRQSIAILKNKGLVEMISLNPQTSFYYLSQALPAKKEVAEIINAPLSEIEKPLLRKQDWIHNQWCEFWALIIKRMYPEVQIVREYTINSNQIAKNVLQIKSIDIDLLPDFLLIFPKTEAYEATHIAFEIERTRKSNKRIMKKFRKYLDGTKIDGLIYICDSGRLSETLRMLYQNKIVDNSQRVKQYTKNFFLFSDSMAGGGPQLDRLFNASGEPVDFQQWCHILRSTKWTLRRDDKFKS